MDYLYSPLIRFEYHFAVLKCEICTVEYTVYPKQFIILSFNVNCNKMAFENYNSKRFIYMADDDSDDREFFADALSEIDLDVILKQEHDGMHLMDSLLTLSESELPDFIFLDINMPGKTGLECLAEIRSSEGVLKDVNIVMLSTSSDPENILRASELGATFYAVKPSCFERLKSLLEEVLSMNLVGAGEGNKKFLLV
jgi:CheY-like chemotaxis protein